MREIPLTQGKVALVDDEDYERIAAHKWQVLRSRGVWCARRFIRRGGRKTIYMHREILGLSFNDGMETDHHNGNGFDNRRSNLRIVTNSQNQANGKPRRDNCSGFKGVGWSARFRKWRARIRVNRVRIHLGWFDTPEAADKAYRYSAEQHFGDFAFHRREEVCRGER